MAVHAGGFACFYVLEDILSQSTVVSVRVKSSQLNNRNPVGSVSNETEVCFHITQ